MIEEIAILVAAVGVVLVLAPLPWLDRWATRLLGLALIAGAWSVLAIGILPTSLQDRLGEWGSSPTTLAGMILAGLVALALVAGAAHLLDQRPLIWFVLLGLALPVRVPIALGDGDTARLLVPLYGVILIGVAILIGRRVRGRGAEIADPGAMVGWATAAFVAWTVASASWSSDPEESAVKLVFFYLPFTVLWLCVLGLWGRRALPTLSATTIALAIPVATLALYQFATRDIFWNATLQQANVYSRLYRVNAIFFDPNILGRWLAICLVGAFALALWRARPRDALLLSVGGVVLLAGLIVTFSRSSALMLMVGLAILAWRAFGRRTTILVLGCLVIAGSIGALATSDQIRRAATSYERLEQVSEGRFGLIRGGIDIWRAHPVRGGGLGSFADRFSETLDERARNRTRVVISHNTPVTVLAEGGLIGGILLALLAVALAARLAQGTRTAGADAWFAYAGLAVLAGILLHAVFYSGLFEDPYAWVIAAGALALISTPRPDAPNET